MSRHLAALLFLMAMPGFSALIDLSNLHFASLGFAGVRLRSQRPVPERVAAEAEVETDDELKHLSKQYLRALSQERRQRSVFRTASRITAGTSAVIISGWLPSVQFAVAGEPPLPADFDFSMLIAQSMAQASQFVSEALHLPL